jgi:hypothetical protein
MQADLLTLLIALIDENVRWFPQTLVYSQMSTPFPIFLKATQHKYFVRLATVTGINTAEELRAAVRKGGERLGMRGWHQFMFQDSFDRALNLEQLDTVK